VTNGKKTLVGGVVATAFALAAALQRLQIQPSLPGAASLDLTFDA